MSRDLRLSFGARAARSALAWCGAGIALLAATPTLASAQDRLVGLRALSGGAVYEQVRFGDLGLLQPSITGGDSLRLTGVSQLSFPLTAAVPLGRNWTLDLTTVYSAGEVQYTTEGSAVERTASLSGLSDVRVRTTGRFFDDGMIFTLGLNAPTGQIELDSAQLTALRALSAPALGLGATPVGAGPSGTVGLLSARTLGEWSVAAGVAYEYRGQYQPVAALTAGIESTDFQPGGVIRVSLGLDRLIGPHRLSMTASGNLFQTDELLGADGASAPLATVQLGPVYTGDIQLQLGVPRVRDLILWSAVRYRSNFSRDDVTVDSSSGVYLDGGVRTTVPLARRTDLVLALDGRYQSGLAIDEGLPTIGVTSGSFTLGFSQSAGNLVFQPFARGSLGNLNARGMARDRQQASFTGVTGGLVIITRF